jgi:hypothetical protein
MGVSHRKLILGLALVALFLPLPCAAQNIRLYPVDESYKDQSFKLFRDQLLSALKRRDKQFLLSIVHPDILNSLGGNGGVKEFAEDWKLDSSQSKVWSELYKVLSMGGTFEEENGEKVFSAPYVSSRWNRIQPKLKGEFGEVAYEAIIGARVKVYSRPDLDASALTYLSYDIVEVDYEGSVMEANHEDFRWVKIKLKRGRGGYVRGSQIRSPSDKSAHFKKFKGKWMMYIFSGGE